MSFYKKRYSLLILTLIIGTISISGCSKVHKELGFGRNSPDEFTVVKRAPLSLPPEYDLLPPDPDRQTKATSNGRDLTEQAQSIVFGEDNTDLTESSFSSEATLLNNIGVTDANPDIRKTIDRETGYVVLDEEKNISEKILFWKDNNEPSIINATEEQERIQKNIDEDLPINTGDVPTIEKKKSTIDKLF